MDLRSIALVCYGNVALSGRPAPPFPVTAWIEGQDTFVFRVPGADASGEAIWCEIAHSPDAWFRLLKDDGVTGLRLVGEAETDGWRDVWKLNGVRTTIEAVGPDGVSAFWVASADTAPEAPAAAGGSGPAVSAPAGPLKRYWRQLVTPLVDADAEPPYGESWATRVLRHALSVPFLPLTVLAVVKSFVAPKRTFERTSWRFFYSRLDTAPTILPAAVDLTAVTSDLAVALAAVRDFATTYPGFFSVDYAARFGEALAHLDGSADASEAEIRRYAPAGLLTGEAKGLIEAVRRAWVFGGMMSWNDMYVADSVPDRAAIEAAHAALSERLYACLTAAVAAAVNTTCKAGSSGPRI